MPPLPSTALAAAAAYPYRMPAYGTMLLPFQDMQSTVLPFLGMHPTTPLFHGVQATAPVPIHQLRMLRLQHPFTDGIFYRGIGVQ